VALYRLTVAKYLSVSPTTYLQLLCTSIKDALLTSHASCKKSMRKFQLKRDFDDFNIGLDRPIRRSSIGCKDAPSTARHIYSTGVTVKLCANGY
jgi:hypothetical protein